MKHIVLLLLAAAAISSCKESVPALPAKITNSDSMAINWFKGNGSMDTVVAVKIIKDSNAINALAEMAGAETVEMPSCGYDGSLHFFKMDKVIQDIRFRMTDQQCRYFEFLLNGKQYRTALSTEAAGLLRSLQ